MYTQNSIPYIQPKEKIPRSPLNFFMVEQVA